MSANGLLESHDQKINTLSESIAVIKIDIKYIRENMDKLLLSYQSDIKQINADIVYNEKRIDSLVQDEYFRKKMIHKMRSIFYICAATFGLLVTLYELYKYVIK